MTELKFKRMIMSMIVLVGMLVMIGLAGMAQVNLESKSKAAIRAKQYSRRAIKQRIPKFKKMLDVKLYEAEPLTIIE